MYRTEHMSSTPVRKSAAERRAEILGAAELIARESGLSAITMRAVGARIGIAPTLVVHHIDGMDQLVAHTFARIVRAELNEIIAFAESVPGVLGVPGQRGEPGGEGALDAVLTTLLQDGRTEVTLVWVEAWVLGRTNELLATEVRSEMDAWREFFTDLIEAGAAEGIYRVADAGAVAGQLLGMLDGLNAHSLVGWQDDTHRVELLLRAARAMLGAGGVTPGVAPGVQTDSTQK